MTQAVSVTTDMSNLTLASFGVSAYSILASVPASSISGSIVPPQGEVLWLSFHLPERSTQVNPALWRLDMELSQDDTEDLVRFEEPGDYTLSGHTEVGTVRAVDVVKQQLYSLIDKLNELLGADLTDNDALTLTQLEEYLAANKRLAEKARANDEEHYAVGFDDAFGEAVIDLVLRNQKLFAKLQDDPEFRQVVKDHIRPRVYGRQRTEEGAGRWRNRSPATVVQGARLSLSMILSAV